MVWNLSSDIWKATSIFIADSPKIEGKSSYSGTCSTKTRKNERFFSHRVHPIIFIKKGEKNLTLKLSFWTLAVLLASCSSAVLASSSSQRANITNYFSKKHQLFLTTLPVIKKIILATFLMWGSSVTAQKIYRKLSAKYIWKYFDLWRKTIEFEI